MKEKQIPIGVQLWSVHDAIAQAMPQTLEGLATMGYEGVEMAGFSNQTPKAWATQLKACGLKVAGAHVGIEALMGDAFEATLDAYAEIGCTRFNVPSLGGHYTNSLDGYRRACAEINQAAARAKARGCFVGYHNHDFEFRFVENRVPYFLMLDCLTTDVEIQFDMGWVYRAGVDGATLVKTLPNRVKSVHLKAYQPGDDAAPVGEDSVPWDAVFAACETVGGTEWYVVEHENYGDLTPMQCVARCLENLKKMA